MRAGRVLRQIIIARIKDQVAGLTGVYDKATESASTPYCTLGASYWNDASVECVKARLQTLQVDVWHGQTSKGALEDIVDDISAALDGFADTSRLTMPPLRVSLVRIMDDPSGDVHGVIQVEAKVEA